MTAAASAGAAAAPARTARSLAWARRRQRLAESWALFSRNRAGMFGLAILLIAVVLALLAPILAPSSMLDVTQLLDNPRNGAPSLAHPLGTDHQGRELWVRLLWGGRISLLVGVCATVICMAIGTLVGLAAAYLTGIWHAIIMRIIDFFLVVPSLILAIVLSSVLSRGALTIIIAIGLTSWAGTARVVRAQALTIQSRPYVERSVALGAGSWHVMTAHILPGVTPLVLANTTLTVGSAIIAESTLSFLGLGDTTQQSWGTILKDAMSTSAATSGHWWYVLEPGLAILLVVLAFTLVGRALETVLNPTLRGE